MNRSGKPSPLKSSKILPPARFGPRTPSPARSATFSNGAISAAEPKRVRRDQVLRRHLFGMLSQRHVRDVQKPDDSQVPGRMLQKNFVNHLMASHNPAGF